MRIQSIQASDDFDLNEIQLCLEERTGWMNGWMDGWMGVVRLLLLELLSEHQEVR